MRNLMLGAAMLCLIAGPAQAMTVAEFLAKVHAIKALGVSAVFSPDIAVLRQEVARASDAYRADLAAAQAAGRKPHSCPPPKGQVPMTSSDLIAELEKIPRPRRTMSMKQAFYGIMLRRYPCR